jgi:hypothetical protein
MLSTSIVLWTVDLMEMRTRDSYRNRASRAVEIP